MYVVKEDYALAAKCAVRRNVENAMYSLLPTSTIASDEVSRLLSPSRPTVRRQRCTGRASGHRRRAIGAMQCAHGVVLRDGLAQREILFFLCPPTTKLPQGRPDGERIRAVLCGNEGDF